MTMPRKLTEADLKVGTRFNEKNNPYNPFVIVALKSDHGFNHRNNFTTLDKLGDSGSFSKDDLLADDITIFEPPIKKEVEFYCGVYEKGEINRHDAMAKTFNVNTCLLRFENFDDIKSESYKRVIKITGTAELINIGEDNEEINLG
jgi:hypothetical protein